MKTTLTQKSVSQYADLCWQLLADVCEISPKKRPDVFLFLSKESKGSLKSRSDDEIALVHFQQMHSQGITLFEPPRAWVSTLAQVPEETSHLFALCHQPQKKHRYQNWAESAGLHHFLRSMTLHECFGHFGARMIGGSKIKPAKFPRPKALIQDREDIWKAAHLEGYFLGDRLADRYFKDQLKPKDIRHWLSADWLSKNGSRKNLRWIYKRLKITAASADFL